MSLIKKEIKEIVDNYLARLEKAIKEVKEEDYQEVKEEET